MGRPVDCPAGNGGSRGAPELPVGTGGIAKREVGPLLRRWRKHRRLTQLDLAFEPGISARHLSFIEAGRSTPSAEVLLRLAGQLEVPFRERNQLLMAAGHAPAFPQRSLQDPELAAVREALDLILTGHAQYPAPVIDRNWNLIVASASMAAIGKWIAPALLAAPVNVMPVDLHPRGLARWIVNLDAVRAYFLGRLRRRVSITGDPRLADLLAEVASYPAARRDEIPVVPAPAGEILTPPMWIRPPGGGELAFLATVARFGTATEVSTSELSIELAFPVDTTTAAALRQISPRPVAEPSRPR